MDSDFDVGVIVGRFQVPELHDAHRALIQHVKDAHDKVIVVLGLAPVVTIENSLDFESRKQMLLDEFSSLTVMYVKDVNDDKLWSKRLDEIVKNLITPSQSALIYGGRDSFIPFYAGQFETRELKLKAWTSGTEIRKQIARSSTIATADFRKGVVWAASSRFPTSFATVDVAVFNDDETELLLGKKSYETKFRFFGGFTDPADSSYEAAARREVMEEAGITITDPKYVTSMNIDDWRYRGTSDQIKTMFFKTHLLSGRPTPGDDIAQVRWFTVPEIVIDWPVLIVDTHWPLLHAVVPNIDRK